MRRSVKPRVFYDGEVIKGGCFWRPLFLPWHVAFGGVTVMFETWREAIDYAASLRA